MDHKADAARLRVVAELGQRVIAEMEADRVGGADVEGVGAATADRRAWRAASARRDLAPIAGWSRCFAVSKSLIRTTTHVFMTIAYESSAGSANHRARGNAPDHPLVHERRDG